MKKTTTYLYLAILLGIIIGACSPCDDGDFEESTTEFRHFSSDSTSIN